MSIDRWMNKENVVHIYNIYIYSAIKNNVICSNMDGPRDYHTKWSKSEKDNYHMISHVWNLKYDTNELMYETEMDSQT